MSNRVYESFLKSGLPKRPDGESYSPTAYNVYRTILYRYDERTGAAYPGLAFLLLSTGKSKSTVLRALKELRDGGMMVVVNNGHRNQRAEYRPAYHLALLNSVPMVGPNTGDKESQLSDQRVPMLESMRPTSASKASHQSDPISTLSKSKYDKDRFENVILKNIPIEKRSSIKLGENLENLLDELERLGTSSQAISKHVNAINWESIDFPGGFLFKSLSALKAECEQKNRQVTELAAEEIRILKEYELTVSNRAPIERVSAYADMARAGMKC